PVASHRDLRSHEPRAPTRWTHCGAYVGLDVGVLDGALTAPGSTGPRATRERRAVRPPSAFVGGSLVRAVTKRAARGQHPRRFGRRLYRGHAGAVLSPTSPDRDAEPDTASTHRRARR